jgi:hypothetical protein
MAKRSLALLLMCLGALLAMPVLAQADTTDIIEPQNNPPTAANGFQAITCTSDEPTKCSPETPELFYTQAGGHPPIGFTQYLIQHEETTGNVEPAGIPIPTSPIKEPIAGRTIKTLRVDLPPGLTVNPNATPKCSLTDFENTIGENHVPLCDETTIVGREEVTLVTNIAGAVPAPSPPFPAGQTLPKGAVVPPSESTGTKVPVYNLTPKEGEPALFGFVVAGKEEVFLETEVAWQSDFHESFTIRLPGPSAPFSTLKSRLVNFGQEAGNQGLVKAGNGTYINNPTTCFDPKQADFSHLYSTWFRAESYEEPNPTFPAGSTPVEAKVEGNVGGEGVPIQQTGCDKVPFNPGLDTNPGTTQVDSPANATVDTTLKYLTGAESEVQESHLRSAEVTLPEGMGLNPSGANGLVACTDAQFKKGVRTYTNECPAASQVGSATIESPPLERPLVGDVYVGTQNSNKPESGELFRILVEAKEQKEGIDVRLVGHIKANEKTGQLTAVFDEQQKLELTGGNLPEGLPQVPFTSVKLHFDGSKAVLTTPPTCSAAVTSGQFVPWARPTEKVSVQSKPFTLSTDPAGGTCPKTLAERKFTPTYKAGTNKTTAGSYSPFQVHITRKDGEQELKVVNVTLPKGLTGKLAGIPYCPESAITAAAGRTATEEQAKPSCPDSSFLGTAETTSGTGSHPVKLPGNVYLAGPYKGAPISLVVTTPAKTGPFDLGVVVVRVALNVSPETAQVNAVSDPIPDVFGGVKLDLRAIDININRKKFMVNPTNCAKQATTGALQGGGADPANPAAFSSYAVNDPFQATACNKLGFKPKLKINLYGPTKRAKNPRLKAVLTAPSGQANIARTAVTMPHSLFLDQSHIGTVCTRPQLASHTCPKASIYGSAEAKSPLLSGKLKGKVYLVSSNHELPDLLADMRGQVEIYLRGVISSKRGGLKTVFNNTPDVPVSRVVLNMKGGKKSLLVNSTNTCAKTQRAVVKIKGQNGKKANNNKQKLNIVSCGKKHKKK